MKVIEFLGMPQAGKSTNIESLESHLKHERNCKVRKVVEGARICPINKERRFYYNSWSFHRTINKLIEVTGGSAFDHVLVDRGPFDSKLFTKALSRNGSIDSKVEEDSIQYMDNFQELIDLVVIFMVDPEVSISREKKYNDIEGRVMNNEFLSILYEEYVSFCERYSNQENFLAIDGEDPIEENHDLITEKVLS
ncbi:MAG: hypothetical protein ABEJ24_04875 [Candidatus Magasanikbacteria bacterium]